MPIAPWRGAVNMITYSLQFVTDLNSTNADITADAIIEYRSFGDGPEFFLSHITDALASDDILMAPQWAEPPHGREDLRHSEVDIRQFLTMIAAELRRRQPWPPKPEGKGNDLPCQ